MLLILFFLDHNHVVSEDSIGFLALLLIITPLPFLPYMMRKSIQIKVRLQEEMRMLWRESLAMPVHDSELKQKNFQWKNFIPEQPLNKKITQYATNAQEKLKIKQYPPSPNRRKTIPQEIRSEVWRQYGGQCALCGAREDLQFDHIIPVSKGGGNSLDNLQILCGNCNRRKGACI